MDKAHSVTVSFGGNDSAFADDWRGESVRILRRMADMIEKEEVRPGDRADIRDTNGNTIGGYSISK